MSTHVFTIGAQGSGTDLGEAALKHFKGLEVPIQLPDAGETAEETLQRLLDACGGDHKNLRNVFVGQSARLTYQKAIKERAKELAKRIDLPEDATEEQIKEAGGTRLTRDEAVQELLAIASGPVPQHTVRGEGESKPRSASVKKAIDAEKVRQRDTIRANMASMPERARKAALENLRVLMPEMYELVTAEDGEGQDDDE